MFDTHFPVVGLNTVVLIGQLQYPVPEYEAHSPSVEVQLFFKFGAAINELRFVNTHFLSEFS